MKNIIFTNQVSRISSIRINDSLYINLDLESEVLLNCFEAKGCSIKPLKISAVVYV